MAINPPDIPGRHIAGVDEAGRGPLAGPVIAAAVILDPENPVNGLKDSKQLTPSRRKALYLEITQKVIAWAVGRAGIEEIYRLNILQATLLAMQRAVVMLRPANGLPSKTMQINSGVSTTGSVDSNQPVSLLGNPPAVYPLACASHLFMIGAGQVDAAHSGC